MSAEDDRFNAWIARRRERRVRARDAEAYVLDTSRMDAPDLRAAISKLTAYDLWELTRAYGDAFLGEVRP